nr:hypothetical protein [uncultured Albidiferax sp.]
MTPGPLGKMIRCHTDDAYSDVGRIVHVSRNGELAYFIPCRSTRKGQNTYTAWYVADVQVVTVASLEDTGHNERFNGELTLVDFVPPPQWRLTDQQLSAGICQNGLVGQRANLKDWLRERQEKQSWIAPILEQYSVEDLLEYNALPRAVQERAKELGHTNPIGVRQALRLWLYGCGDPNALLPAKFRLGAPGQLKEFKTKPGRPPKDFIDQIKPTKGYVATLADKENLAKGRQRYKKKGVSEYHSYLLTCAQYWSGVEVVLGKDGRKFALAPPGERPTLAEFRNAAMTRGLTSARRLNIGEHTYDMCERARRAASTYGIRAVGQMALIDSTSEDQTPVSSLSRLLVLPTTYRTVVMDVRTQYIQGVYCGFEHPSTRTSLLAILSAATSKVEMCAKYGIPITDDDWYVLMPKGVRLDNGELKSKEGIDTLTLVGASMEITAAYAAVLKNILEASHRSLHAHADHQAAASTKGRRRARGEPDRKDDACRTFEENMRSVIQAILRHNNEDLVPGLLIPQMIRDGVTATRAAIYRWYVSNAYVASTPSDIDSLRTRCLPSLDGVLHREGIRLYNPLDPRELIDGLIFSSPWLRQSGLCDKSARRAVQRQVEIKLKPDELGHCYFEYGGQFHRLDNQDLDVECRSFTLVEYIQFSEERKRVGRAGRASLEECDYKIVKENRDVNKAAKKAKIKEAREVVAQGGEIIAPRQQSLRANVVQERRLHRMQQLGLGEVQKPNPPPELLAPMPEADKKTSHETTQMQASPDDQQALEIADATAKLMARYRSKRVLID